MCSSDGVRLDSSAAVSVGQQCYSSMFIYLSTVELFNDSSLLILWPQHHRLVRIIDLMSLVYSHGDILDCSRHIASDKGRSCSAYWDSFCECWFYVTLLSLITPKYFASWANGAFSGGDFNHIGIFHFVMLSIVVLWGITFNSSSMFTRWQCLGWVIWYLWIDFFEFSLRVFLIFLASIPCTIISCRIDIILENPDNNNNLFRGIYYTLRTRWFYLRSCIISVFIDMKKDLRTSGIV